VVKQVKGALETNAAPLATEAKDALKQCTAMAKKLKVLSEPRRTAWRARRPRAIRRPA